MDYVKLFLLHVKKMWHIGKKGKKYSLKPDLNEVSNPLLRLLLPKNNVNYFILEEDNKIKIYIEESHKKYDWRMNFMAYTVKTCIGGLNRRYHAGFYITAMTVFNHLKKTGKLDNQVVEAYGYSLGAAALPIFGSLVRHRTTSSLLGDRVIGFESPCCIFKPSREVRAECFRDLYFIQGSDVVTDVPWWMKHLGTKMKIPGRKLTGIRKLFKGVFDHDIYWSRDNSF